MKVIFLDIDGVLNSHQEVYYHNRIRQTWRYKIKNKIGNSLMNFIELFYKKHSYWWSKAFRIYIYYFTDHCDFCPIACSNIQYILDKCPEVRIVVSSVWRTNKRLRQILKRNGIDSSKVIGITPTDIHAPRGNQIQAWLDMYKERMGESIEKFVIIDDDSDMEHLIKHLHQTNGHHGLQFDMAMEIIDYFNEESKENE